MIQKIFGISILFFTNLHMSSESLFNSFDISILILSLLTLDNCITLK